MSEKTEDAKPETVETEPVVSSEDVTGFEVHDLSLREQLMRQWPSRDYEKR